MKAKNIITAAFIALTSLTSCQKSKAETVEQYANSYQPGDGNMAMLYITNATARFCSFTGKPERSINF